VKVLGTKFNVMADPSTGAFSTALLQGMVQLKAKDSDSEIILKPGEKAELINGKLRKSRIINPDEYLWTDGIISLQSNSFRELLDKLEKAYDVRFVVRREQMPVVHCKGKIRVSDGIEHAMEILKLGTEFDYEINHSSNEIYIY
jgi:ferric-dicitrate binding protein FerR (iron transport regulator)